MIGIPCIRIPSEALMFLDIQYQLGGTTEWPPFALSTPSELQMPQELFLLEQPSAGLLDR